MVKMIKYCPMIGCNRKLTWTIEDTRLKGVCDIHGHVCGVFIWKPLTFIEKVLLRIKGYNIKE